MKIRYHNRNKKNVPYAYDADLVALAKNSDVLLIVTPGGAGTAKLVNAKVLDALGPQGYVVNVARGSVVDEPVLLRYLQEKKIAGAGLDVFEHEPKVPGGVLRARQRGAVPARGERHGGNAQGDGRPAGREPAPAFRRQAGEDAGGVTVVRYRSRSCSCSRGMRGSFAFPHRGTRRPHLGCP